MFNFFNLVIVNWNKYHSYKVIITSQFLKFLKGGGGGGYPSVPPPPLYETLHTVAAAICYFHISSQPAGCNFGYNVSMVCMCVYITGALAAQYGVC